MSLSAGREHVWGGKGRAQPWAWNPHCMEKPCTSASEIVATASYKSGTHIYRHQTANGSPQQSAIPAAHGITGAVLRAQAEHAASSVHLALRVKPKRVCYLRNTHLMQTVKKSRKIMIPQSE